MKIVVATIKYSQKGECNITFDEVEFDGTLIALADILDITEYKPEVMHSGGGGCPSTGIEIEKSYAMSRICDEHVYPIAFIYDGIYFSGERKIAFYGVENAIYAAPVHRLADIQEKIIYPDHSK